MIEDKFPIQEILDFSGKAVTASGNGKQKGNVYLRRTLQPVIVV